MSLKKIEQIKFVPEKRYRVTDSSKSFTSGTELIYRGKCFCGAPLWSYPSNLEHLFDSWSKCFEEVKDNE